MVKLNKIYTKTGDDGTTGLVGGIRVSKDDPRVEAYGAIDESNAAVGLAVVQCDTHAEAPTGAAIRGHLQLIQHDLFDLGADLATPVTPDEKPGSALRIIASQTDRLEATIDEFNEKLAPLTSFVLPGGTPLAAALHLARTIVRRAERHIVTLQRIEPANVSEESVKYVNRLSDLLFVFCRAANFNGTRDVLWKPGATR
ncbi:MAG: cob(I)yrinic acid a,c-diamide adenosyltransferase [Phycisphaerales bacterium]